MNRATSRWADSVFNRTWELRDELADATPEQFRAAQAELKHLLARVPETEERGAQPDFFGLAYPLVCWVDQHMVSDSRIGRAWSEALLEDQLFGTDDRDWMFWKQAGIAETMTDQHAVELFYLCVAHGFTGDFWSDPDALEDWMQRVQAQLGRSPDLCRPFPTALAPPPAVTPLHGRRMMRSMIQVGWVAALLLLPTLSYVGMRNWML